MEGAMLPMLLASHKRGVRTRMPAAVAAAGWDEILEGGLAEGATVMSWRVGHSLCVGLGGGVRGRSA